MDYFPLYNFYSEVFVSLKLSGYVFFVVSTFMKPIALMKGSDTDEVYRYRYRYLCEVYLLDIRITND